MSCLWKEPLGVTPGYENEYLRSLCRGCTENNCRVKNGINAFDFKRNEITMDRLNKEILEKTKYADKLFSEYAKKQEKYIQNLKIESMKAAGEVAANLAAGVMASIHEAASIEEKVDKANKYSSDAYKMTMEALSKLGEISKQLIELNELAKKL